MISLLNYVDAKDFFIGEDAGDQVRMIRKIDDRMGAPWFLPELKSPQSWRSKYRFGKEFGDWRPFGEFSRFYGGKYSKEEVYDNLIEAISVEKESYLDGRVGSFTSVAMESYFMHKDIWEEELPEDFSWNEEGWINSFSAWVFGTVDGILGETSVIREMNKNLKGTAFTVERAPVSMEKRDIDALVLGGDRDLTVSIKTGSKSGVRSAINFKRSQGKIPDFYYGFVRNNGKKLYYFSKDGETFKKDAKKFLLEEVENV